MIEVIELEITVDEVGLADAETEVTTGLAAKVEVTTGLAAKVEVTTGLAATTGVVEVVEVVDVPAEITMKLPYVPD